MHLRSLSWLALVAVLGLGACGGGGGGGGGGGANCLPGPGPNYGAFPQNATAAELQLAADVLTLVNNERANNGGIPPVAAHAPSAKVAFDYSVDMEQRNFFDHVNPECEDPGVRLTRAGIGWSTYGENIAQGQTTAAQVMTAWMNSPGHRANILNPAFTRMGVGVRQAAGGTIWTQLFSAP
jgi:uncharacterized protein YkwD